MIVFVGLAVLTLLISIIAHFIVGGRPFYHFAYVLFIIGMLAEVSINIIQRQTQAVVRVYNNDCVSNHYYFR